MPSVPSAGGGLAQGRRSSADTQRTAPRCGANPFADHNTLTAARSLIVRDPRALFFSRSNQNTDFVPRGSDPRDCADTRRDSRGDLRGAGAEVVFATSVISYGGRVGRTLDAEDLRPEA